MLGIIFKVGSIGSLSLLAIVYLLIGYRHVWSIPLEKEFKQIKKIKKEKKEVKLFCSKVVFFNYIGFGALVKKFGYCENIKM